MATPLEYLQASEGSLPSTTLTEEKDVGSIMPTCGDPLNNIMLTQGYEEEQYSGFPGVPAIPGVYQPARHAENFNELFWGQ